MKLGMFPVRQPDASFLKSRPQQSVETETETRHRERCKIGWANGEES